MVSKIPKAPNRIDGGAGFKAESKACPETILQMESGGGLEAGFGCAYRCFESVNIRLPRAAPPTISTLPDPSQEGSRAPGGRDYLPSVGSFPSNPLRRKKKARRREWFSTDAPGCICCTYRGSILPRSRGRCAGRFRGLHPSSRPLIHHAWRLEPGSCHARAGSRSPYGRSAFPSPPRQCRCRSA